MRKDYKIYFFLIITSKHQLQYNINQTMLKELKFFWETVKETFAEWNNSSASNDSASLAYYAIFSIPGLTHHHYPGSPDISSEKRQFADK